MSMRKTDNCLKLGIIAAAVSICQLWMFGMMMLKMPSEKR